MIDEERVLLGVIDRGAVLAEVREGVDDEAAPVRLSDIEDNAAAPDESSPETDSDQESDAANRYQQTEEAVQ